ncbi:undecaprenyl-diphosphatase [Streptomyces sp. TLI_235]|nr:phosphatase PAP2 family protein [Streptomyces sp. TLI_235]PBC77273.1 undecaprenyl-diphosphatase [Streptomyces sp. TLI_235]
MTPALLAYDGSGIDGGLYTRVVGWAGTAPHWLDRLIADWSALGLGVFALLMLGGWWQARGAAPAVMARALAAPLIVVAAYAADTVVKSAVAEVRPCRQLAVGATLEGCPAAGDWSFPSNHTVIAFAAAAALWTANRRLGALALIAAALMGVSRVWVGVHYPHDVLAGALVGLLAGALLAAAAGRAAPLVERARTGRLGGFLGEGVPA